MMAEESIAQLVWALFTKDQIEAAVARSRTLAELADDELFERTPGIRRALHALASTRKANVARIASGEKPQLGGEPVSLKTFAKKLGTTPGELKSRAKEGKQGPRTKPPPRKKKDDEEKEKSMAASEGGNG